MGVDHWGAVTKFRTVVHLRRDSGDLLQQKFSHEASVPCGTTGHHVNLFDPRELPGTQLDTV